MKKFVALLRGVNVGGKTVKMDRLRARFEALGFENVRTYIQSGNVLFGAGGDASETLREVIEEALSQEFGFDITVLLLAAQELAALLATNPFAGRILAEGERVHITVFEATPPEEAVKLLKPDPASVD
jgi:uncharacterized protein (DUF1697 family)